MRSALAAALMLATLPASAAEGPTAGHVAGGLFGMGGSDYYGEVRNRMPFSGEWAERPVGVGEIERVRAARRTEAASVRQLRRKAVPAAARWNR